MSDIISIPTTSISSDGVVYYHISIKLPLRSFNITKRYSEFIDLVDKLCYDLGISTQDFPYQLPPKTNFFTSSKSQSTINDRKLKFNQFLNSLIRDKDLQNNSIVHNFLQLPINFQFTDQLFRSVDDEKSLSERDMIIDDESLINQFKWLEILRLFKFNINELSKKFRDDNSINLKISTRDKVNKLIKPNLKKLNSRLSTLLKSRDIDSNEFNRRVLLFKEVENDLSNLQDNLLSHNSMTNSNSNSYSNNYTLSGITNQRKDLLNGNSQNGVNGNNNGRRVFGKSSPPNKSSSPNETNDTMSLGNQGLLQQQQQVHNLQDQELEQLRKIVARQRQLGETINTEVQEQNQLLDMFADEVDHTSDKVRLARKKARNVV